VKITSLQRLGPVELLAHVIGDLTIQPRFGVGQLVGDRVGDPLGEQRLAVEPQQLLLDQPAHQVRGVGLVDPVAELALEAVAVEQRHEQLEVGLLAVVRRGGQQQEVPRHGGEQLPQPVTLGVRHLVAEIRAPGLVTAQAQELRRPGLAAAGLPRGAAQVAAEYVFQQFLDGEAVGQGQAQQVALGRPPRHLGDAGLDVGALQHVPGGEDHGLQHVVKLADVAGPGVTLEKFVCVRGKGFVLPGRVLPAHLAVDVAQQVAGDVRDVGLPGPQPR
jgi:hypothetical protein